jgi:hypothetical protein
MAVFDQRGQHVVYQYNAAHDINIASVVNGEDLAKQLERVREELRRARSANVISEEQSIEPEFHLGKAIVKTREAKPDKDGILSHLGKVTEAVRGIAALAGFAQTVKDAVQKVRALF